MTNFALMLEFMLQNIWSLFKVTLILVTATSIGMLIGNEIKSRISFLPIKIGESA